MKNTSYTKTGPGRKPERVHNADKKVGELFVKGLLATWARTRRNDKARHLGLRDQYGAFTMVGRSRDPVSLVWSRRKWLAGISAQRGY
jgi:hypothetical protein